MDQLLNKKIPESRLGGPTFNSLKKNPWFNDFSWVLKYNYFRVNYKIKKWSHHRFQEP